MPNHRERTNKADASWGDAELSGGARHFDSNQIVSECDAPDFLANALRGSAANGFLPLKKVGLDFVIAEFDFPALMVEVDNLRGWESG